MLRQILIPSVLSLLKRPILITIALSLLLHALLLFGPKLIELTPVEVPLPPLIAHLEPLPAVKKPRPTLHPKPHHKSVIAPIPVVTKSDTEMALATVTPAASAVVSAPVEAAPAASAAESAPVETPVVAKEPAHPLPKHAQLTFVAYLGTNFPIGEVRHRLDIDKDNNYTLQVGMNTTGIARLFKTFVMNQQSSGKLGARGLRPDQFTENRQTSKGTQALTAQFDWDNKQLNFSAGDHVALPEGAQDLLSFLYQFSQMPLDQSTLSIYVSNGKKLETYQLEVGTEEEIKTPLGKLRALPLRKINAPGEEGLEIWLGLEYRLLPVKILSINKKGEPAGELDISEIRVSEE